MNILVYVLHHTSGVPTENVLANKWILSVFLANIGE